MLKDSKDERDKLNENHDSIKKELKISIIKLKFELDKVLSLKINL